jgi:hypothetical protein
MNAVLLECFVLPGNDHIVRVNRNSTTLSTHVGGVSPMYLTFKKKVLRTLYKPMRPNTIHPIIPLNIYSYVRVGLYPRTFFRVSLPCGLRDCFSTRDHFCARAASAPVRREKKFPRRCTRFPIGCPFGTAPIQLLATPVSALSHFHSGRSPVRIKGFW